MTDKGKLIDKLNDSDSRDSSALGGILPKQVPHVAKNVEKTIWQKYKVWIIVGVLAAIALIIGLSVGLTRNKPGPSPTPTPTPTPTPQGLNPYKVDQANLNVQVNEVSGRLIANEKSLSTFNVCQESGIIKAQPDQIPVGANNALFKQVSFEFGQVNYQMAKAVFTEADAERYSIPENLVPKPQVDSTMRLEQTGFHLMNDPFGFRFVDPMDSNNVLLTTANQTFIMWDKYMQMDLVLPTRRIYGLGERNREFTLKEGTWTMWANGQETPYDDGSGGKQVYGVHPFVLVQTAKKGEFMGVFFRNSNAQSPVIRYVNENQVLFQYITTGGQIEVYFMFKGSAQNIIQQYQNLVGKPNLPPFWALGWHAAAYAYSTQDELQENLDGYKNNSFPLEGVWIDIDYMAEHADFSVNTTAFPTIKNLTKTIQAEGKRMILIVDAGLSAESVQNPYYSQALSQNVLLKSSINQKEQNGVLTQHVWQNHTVFLDFLAEGAKDIWGQGFLDLWDQIPYDGIWLDMNEATGFCNGECPNGTTHYKNEQKVQIIKKKMTELLQKQDLGEDKQNHTWWISYNDQENNSTYELPFIPGLFNLDNMSISLNATHPSTGDSEFNMHSLFGHSEGKVTYEFLTDQSVTPLKDKRVFLLSRSTFSGSGKYVQHWLGDNHRTLADMRHSISGIMNFNMFGIPLVGPDTCGFFGEAGQDELCARWVQLATFFPFARQHRDKYGGGGKNEIWRMSEPWKTMAQNALFDRLQYLRHVYSCQFLVSQEGGTCFDPLFYHFPYDDETFTDDQHSTMRNIEGTFIVAGAFKVSPVLDLNIEAMQTYFPNGEWVSMKHFGSVLKINENDADGKYQHLEAPNDTVIVHLMPGKIAIFQDNHDHSKFLTKDLGNAIQLIVNRNPNKHANVKAFFDDGESLSQLQNKSYEHYEFLHNGKSLLKQILNENVTASTGFHLEKLVITNAPDLSNIDTACYIANNNTVFKLSATYDSDMQVLNITAQEGTDASQLNFFDMKSIHYLQRGVDINHCDPFHDYYQLQDAPTDFDQNVGHAIFHSPTDAFKTLNMTFSVLDSYVLNIRWNYQQQNLQKQPFEVPEEIINVDRTKLLQGAKVSDFVSITNNTGPAIIEIRNKGVKQFEIRGFLLSEFLNQIETITYATTPENSTQTSYLIGVNEEVQDGLFLKDGTYSMWSRDAANPKATGKLPGNNYYGVHPYFMAKTGNGWLGVYQNNAAAQDWDVINYPIDKSVRVTMKATGGTGDLFLMMGPTANDVVKMYHNGVVGNPVLVPQWSLGWSQCRWGYFNLTELQDVVQGYKDNNLPLDNVFSDIDFMDRYRDFTYDKVNYNQLPEFIANLTKEGRQWIPIQDAGIAKRPDYRPYTEGVEQYEGVFIKNRGDGDVFTGRVWPGDVAFVDWFAPRAQQWWESQLTDFFNQLQFSGFWLDMNEASNFCNGVCYDSQAISNPVSQKLEYIPSGRNLEFKSISLDAYHHNNRTQLDTHSLYAPMMVQATHKWFESQNRRTFILSRSFFAGQGKFGSRWQGDNFASAEAMGHSVTGVLQQNIMGVPLVGSDICGFIGDTTPELCARWYTLGSFYTFSRNHNIIGAKSQEPYTFAQEKYEGTTSYLDIIHKAMWTKFIFLKYYYTSLLDLHDNGGTFHRPMYFDFDWDYYAYIANQEQNIMLGDSLKLSVNSNVLDQNYTMFYFPEGSWCNVLKGMGNNTCINSGPGGQNHIMSTKAYEVYVHLQNRSIVPLQDGQTANTVDNVTTTVGMQAYPIQLHINPFCPGGCYAFGSFQNDNGTVLNQQLNTNFYNFILITSDLQTLTLQVTHPKVAMNYPNQIINENDRVNMVRLYNAAHNGYNAPYNVKVTFKDNTTFDTTANYDAVWDSLQFSEDTKKLWLPEITTIVFTKQ